MVTPRSACRRADLKMAPLDRALRVWQINALHFHNEWAWHLQCTTARWPVTSRAAAFRYSTRFETERQPFWPRLLSQHAPGQERTRPMSQRRNLIWFRRFTPRPGRFHSCVFGIRCPARRVVRCIVGDYLLFVPRVTDDWRALTEF